MLRHKDASVLQSDSPPSRKERALRVLADGCLWIGEAFIGLSYIMLSQIRKPNYCRRVEEMPRRLLLPADGQRKDKDMREEIILFECQGCFRKVNILIPIHNINRCEDCFIILNERDKQIQNSWMN